MKILVKILKWTGKIISGTILFIMIVGLCYRLASTPPIPPGKLVDIKGTNLHIRAEGPRNTLPTLVLESGAGGNTDMFHWIAEGMKQQMRVVRYDRESKGFSEACTEGMTPEDYAQQLHDLLKKNGEAPPYIMVGHSMGGPYISIFRELFPDEVKGMIYIDASHPEQWKRLAQKELVPKAQVPLIKFTALLADMGISGAYSAITTPAPRKDGLPKLCGLREQLLRKYSGKIYHRYLQENTFNSQLLQRAAQVRDLDSLPLLIFTAKEQYREAQKVKYRNQGIQPEQEIALWFQMQKELKERSTRGQQFIMDATHGTILTQKHNADFINDKLRTMVGMVK